ncbi:MAG: adenine-specific DNA-methyltransferase [Magnetovibrionaceae bacterium]
MGQENKKYEDKCHAIFQGDAVSVLQNDIENNSVDLIFADPPYNIGKQFGNFDDKWPSDEDYADWCKTWLDLCLEKLTAHGSMYVMTSTQAMPYLDLYLRSKTNILSRIVWSYDSSGMQAKKHYGSMYEPILFCVKDKKNYTFNADDIAVEAKTGAKRKLIDYRKPVPAPYNSKKVPGNVWDFPRVRYRMAEYEDHPSQKPEALLERLILASSNEGDTVLDPFSGSFSTCAVAKRLGRKSIGIEAHGGYVDIGLRRVLGFAEIDGRMLSAPQKRTRQKNRNGVKNAREEAVVGDLFHAGD